MSELVNDSTLQDIPILPIPEVLAIDIGFLSIFSEQFDDCEPVASVCL
jgi:hypothetical protein